MVVGRRARGTVVWHGEECMALLMSVFEVCVWPLPTSFLPARLRASCMHVCVTFVVNSHDNRSQAIVVVLTSAEFVDLGSQFELGLRGDDRVE